MQYAVSALLVARAHDDPGATLDVVGRPVVPAYTDALVRYIDELGLHEAVTLRGSVRDAELADAMAGADVLVVTSEHEGFGVPVIEAMTAGLPVVASRAGALPEIVGEAGELVDATDPWSVAAAVSRVVRNGGRRAELAQAAERQLRALDLPTAADRCVDLVAPLRG
jgi:glycosyltransferase involved in cell wall biosynthesis